MEKKLKHLELIQDVVNRLANNSFLIKGWAVTLVSAIIALAAQENSRTELIYIAFFPILTFWLLDGYFLWQERLFRAVYNEVCAISETQIDFKMNVEPYIKKRAEEKSEITKNDKEAIKQYSWLEAVLKPIIAYSSLS